jgi:hypothetical protein
MLFPGAGEGKRGCYSPLHQAALKTNKLPGLPGSLWVCSRNRSYSLGSVWAFSAAAAFRAALRFFEARTIR